MLDLIDWKNPLTRRKLILLMLGSAGLPRLVSEFFIARTNRDRSSTKPFTSAPLDLSRSVVDRCIGSAEGNLYPDGSKSIHYPRHPDPGNGAINVGIYSVQHCDLSVEQCNQQQYNKLQRIWNQITLPTLRTLHIQPSFYEAINLFDVANQAPACITDESGKVVSGSVMHRLAQARHRQLKQRDGVEFARIWAYWNPHRQQWDAPGLRAYDYISKQKSIKRDVQRRMTCIDAAIEWLRQSELVSVSLSAMTLQVNPYPITKHTDYLYWQLGFWDSCNQQHPRSDDPAYLKGYQR